MSDIEPKRSPIASLARTCSEAFCQKRGSLSGRAAVTVYAIVSFCYGDNLMRNGSMPSFRIAFSCNGRNHRLTGNGGELIRQALT